MIRNPLGLRLDPNRAIRDQIQQAARLGAKGVVLEAAGDLAPHRLGETGRRELKHLLRSVELTLIAVHLPTRRAFDMTDQLDERVRRADAAFAMTFDLGARIVLSQAGAAPDGEAEPARRAVFDAALASLARRAEHRGVRLAIENGAEPGRRLRGFLDAMNDPSLAASVDPPSLLRAGIDPVTAVRELGPWLAHAYAGDAADSPNATRNPRGVGFHPGSLDWEEYIGALEESAYHGFLTVWPEPGADVARAFKAVASRIGEIG
jgi:sugar phosphate isomerase/epimerase